MKREIGKWFLCRFCGRKESSFHMACFIGLLNVFSWLVKRSVFAPKCILLVTRHQ